jgi:hypothetical protein
MTMKRGVSRPRAYAEPFADVGYFLEGRDTFETDEGRGANGP